MLPNPTPKFKYYFPDLHLNVSKIFPQNSKKFEENLRHIPKFQTEIELNISPNFT